MNESNIKNETKETEYNLETAKKLVTSLAAEAVALKKASRGNLCEAVSDWLAVHYLMVLRARLEGKGDEPAVAQRWETLRTALLDWARVRRGDHAAESLALEREELDLDLQNSKFRVQQQFKKWIKDPKVREKYWPKSQGGISEATLHKIERELNLL